jgi:copper chaperone CopZ
MKKIILALSVVLALSAPPAFASHGAGGTIYVDVEGLVCDFCARALEKVFNKQDAVSGIKVDLDTKTITVDLKDGQTLTDEAVTRLITDSGYNVSAIRHQEKGKESEKAE